MINRFLLRIRVVQILYSHYHGGEQTAAAAEKELFHSLDRAYDLYFHLLNLVMVITNLADARLETRKNRLLPSSADLCPNTRFVENQFVKQLSSNKFFKEYLKTRKLSWADDPIIVKELLEKILSSVFYSDYLKAPSFGYENDKRLWRKIFRNIISNNNSLEESLEEQSIYWTDLLDHTVSFIEKTIKNFDISRGHLQSLQKKYGNEYDDVEFARRLLRKTLENENEYRELISKNTSNWDVERIAFMDILIMQVALAELTCFPNIPVNVSLYEYIEIGKYYSTEKSGLFINGVLDKIVNELKKENKLIKVVSFSGRNA
jgi:N utilization substance protein B